MTGILADNDVEGYVGVLVTIWRSDTWRDLWDDLGFLVASLDALALSRESSDAVIWRTCQREMLVLITANRNKDGPDSLEATIQNENPPDSLPVITLANPQRIMRDRLYAETVAERLLEKLVAIDDFHGAGRVYVP
jgi:hypothetical protein